MGIANKVQVDRPFDRVWWRVRERLRAEMDPQRFMYWIFPLRVLSADGERVVIACRTQFLLDQCVLKFGTRITDLIAEDMPGLQGVDFVLDPDRPPPPARAKAVPLVPATPAAQAKPPGDEPPPSSEARQQQRRILIEDVKRRVAERYALTLEQLESPCRKRAVVRGRQIGMLISRRLTGRSYPEIARRFGGRDHTTAIHGCRKIEAERVSDPAVAAEIEALERQLTEQG
jgi:chromosomal replication initiation ATPase DnaA